MRVKCRDDRMALSREERRTPPKRFEGGEIMSLLEILSLLNLLANVVSISVTLAKKK